jgi:hypothetical protein
VVKIPDNFEKCVKNGGKIVRKTLKGNRYITICYGKDGKSYTGEVKTKKKEKAYDNKKQIKNSKALVQDLLRLKKHFDENYRIGKDNT